MDLRYETVPSPAVREFLEGHHSAVVARRGELVSPVTSAAIVGYDTGAVAGVLTYDIADAACEVRTLHVARQWHGLGSRLIDEVAGIARRAGCRTLWLVTTNDNVDALRFYQRRGFRLSAVRCGAVDEARRTIKPQIPALGNYGIPIRDELELSRDLAD
jgi:ribosomal protein S18 acetylase RimI-like enzyme